MSFFFHRASILVVLFITSAEIGTLCYAAPDTNDGTLRGNVAAPVDTTGYTSVSCGLIASSAASAFNVSVYGRLLLFDGCTATNAFVTIYVDVDAWSGGSSQVDIVVRNPSLTGTTGRFLVKIAMWVMAAAFTANALSKPYANAMLSALETASLLCITVSLNLSLLFTYSDKTTNPGLYWGTLIAIMAVNAIMLAAFATALVWSARGKLRAAVLANPWRFASLRWLFENDVESDLQRLQKEVTEMRRRLRELMPRAVLIDEARREGVLSLRMEKLRRSYDVMLATLPLRLRSAGSDSEDVLRELFQLECEILTAERNPRHTSVSFFSP